MIQLADILIIKLEKHVWFGTDICTAGETA